MATAVSTQSFDSKFRSVSEPTRAELRALWPMLEPQLDRIVRNVYSPLGVNDPTTLSRIVDLQRTHFRQLFQGQFDSGFIEETRRRLEQRSALGLAPDTQFQAYAGLLSEFGSLIVATYRKKPERIIEVLAALNRAMMLDLDVTATSQIALVEQKAAAERAKLADRLEQDVRSVISELGHSGQTLRSAAESMAHTADETNREASSVAAEAESATSNVQTVASAADELSASIGEIARQVAQSSAIARKAADEAKRTDITIEGLSNAASRIGEIVKLINSIAGQTNLLALNATIEAARAGEAGKGFAVVAQEVKNLANQTAKATEDITGQVAAIQSATNETVSVMRGIGTTITEINDIAASISAAVEQQGSATNEIARNVQQAAGGTTAVSNTIERVTRAAAETGSAAGHVLNTAQTVNRQSEALERAVVSFLSHIRQG